MRNLWISATSVCSPEMQHISNPRKENCRLGISFQSEIIFFFYYERFTLIFLLFVFIFLIMLIRSRDSSLLDTDAAGSSEEKKKWSPLSHGCWTKYFLSELHPSLQGWASEKVTIYTRACGCTLVMDNPQAGWTSLMEILLMRTGVDQALLPCMFKFWAPSSPATKIASVGWSYCAPADTHNMPARPWTFSCLMVALLPSPVQMQLEMLLKL